MLYINETFGAFNGVGYLTDGGNWKPQVAYKLVLHRDNFTGGGVIFGLSDEDAVKAAELRDVQLEVSIDRSFKLVVGDFDGDPLTTAVTGIRRRLS